MGNDWKNVQIYIKTRSSTQSRSHAQKFFMKIQSFEGLKFNGSKATIAILNKLVNKLTQMRLRILLTHLLILNLVF